MNLIRTYIYQILIILAMTGCDMQKDVSVKFHFEPPFSYHTADFSPVSLNTDNAVTYSIPSFYKIDKRYSGIVISLLVKCPDKVKADILLDLHQVSISVIIRNKSGDVILDESAKLGDLRHKFIEDRTVDIRLPLGHFLATDIENINLNTKTLEPKNNLTGYSLSVRLQELRRK